MLRRKHRNAHSSLAQKLVEIVGIMATYKCRNCSHEDILSVRPAECDICGSRNIVLLGEETTVSRTIYGRNFSFQVTQEDSYAVFSEYGVGNLPSQVTEEDIYAVFSKYGRVTRVALPTDCKTGRPRGYAFVEMATATQADAAVEELDVAEWMGRKIRVKLLWSIGQ